MTRLSGVISHITTYEEPAVTDRWLALSKVLWLIVWLLIPFTLYRFLGDLFGLLHAVAGVLVFLVMIRLIGPLNFILLDEFLCRIFPDFRSAVRIDRSRVYDFRIRDAEGGIIACLLRGSLKGAAPVIGDQISMETEKCGGVFIVKSGWNETTMSRFAIKKPPSKCFFLVALLLLLFSLLYLRGNMDEWLYPWIADLLAAYYYPGI